MEPFALYLFKSVTWLSGFSLVYFLFLRNERFFILKRVYLVSGILISFFFPLISIHYQVVLPAPDVSPVDFTPAGNTALTAVQQGSPDKPFDYRYILLFLYLSGVLFFTFRLIRHIRLLYKAINRANINNIGSAKLIRTSEFTSSFSFFNYVFVNSSIREVEMEEIMNHEFVHVRQKHWFDLLLVELLRLLQWVNPFVWIYIGYIRLNHEYLADEAALQRTSDPVIYRAALLNQMFSSPVISLSNSFNYSLNKNRFDMMKKIITSPYRKMKILFILPVFAIVFYAFATPEYHYVPATDNTMAIYQSPAIITKEVKGVVIKEDGTPFQWVPIVVTGTSIRSISDVSGNFKIGNVPDDAFLVFSFVGHKTQVLKAVFTSEMTVKLMKDPEYKGQIQIRSTNPDDPPPLIVVDWMVSNKGLNEINPDDIQSVHVLKDRSATDKYGEKGKDGVIEFTTKKKAAEISAGTQQKTVTPLVVVDGVISDRSMSEISSTMGNEVGKVTFLKDKEATDKYGEKGKDGVYEIMSIKKAAELGIKIPFRRRSPADYPTFRGEKWSSFSNWVMGQIKYPPEAISKGIQGWAHVSYTVENDGSISNVKTTGTTDPLLGDVIVKAVQSSPEWEPAKNPEATEPFTSQVLIKFELPDKILNDVPYVVVEKMPMFPGGDTELLKFIAENTQYPAEAKANKIQGRVIVRFIVNANGKVEDATILKGVDPLLDAEALRVFGSLPDFIPGSQGGVPVSVYYMCPVTFTLP